MRVAAWEMERNNIERIIKLIIKIINNNNNK